MPRKPRQQEERDKLIAAMQPLSLLPEFQKFISQVQEMKDGAVQYMVNHTTVASERESLVAKGEVRAYLWIIETHRAQLEQLEAQMLAAQSAQAQQQG